MLNRLILHLFIAVDGEVIVIAHNLGLRNQEAAIGSLASSRRRAYPIA